MSIRPADHYRATEPRRSLPQAGCKSVTQHLLKWRLWLRLLPTFLSVDRFARPFSQISNEQVTTILVLYGFDDVSIRHE